MRLRVIFIGHEEKEFLAEQKKYRESIVSSGIRIEVTSIKEGPETIEQNLDELLAGRAAFVLATTLGDRFSIISPLRSLIPVYRRRLQEYGLAAHLCSIRSIDFDILDLLSCEARDAFIRAGNLAVEEDGADTIVLGCTGMSPIRIPSHIMLDR